jgi:2'-5' RNA ligase
MLVIFSKLDIQPPDREWIETIRRVHDPHYPLLAPHVTFVFPFDRTPLGTVLAHATKVARQARPISFRLTRPVAVRDTFGPVSHVFLLPTQGDTEMRALHDRLYAGPLAAKRHPAIPYLPHVTVGAFAEHEAADEMAASLGKFDIPGTVNTIHIADHVAGRLTELHRLKLG